ncbi:chaperonin 10-like protein [Phyllosticta citrichinensis]|uniref:Chaperonin 10-like protein n=1 Tax=Phyllosticta citrichinensis TaxID=1130410 RepID=A0ABR1XEN8_9PEZI
MVADEKFEGWCGLDRDSVHGKMVWQQFQPKPFTDDDVEIAISHCGVCASDLHTLRSGWRETPYPCVVGHEIIGKAVRVGRNVTHVREGDRVGVGGQAGSCLQADCEHCADRDENHCPKALATYGSIYPDGSKTFGGFARYNRTPGHFVFKIPDAVSSADAAPMLCAGITVFSPLKYEGCKGKKVGIIGLGGLGHFGVLFAKALGAEKVVVISHTSTKKEDAVKMGADDFIATSESPQWAIANQKTLDLIVSTVSTPDMPLAQYLLLLKVRGTYIQVGAPEEALKGFNMFSIIAKNLKIGGSIIGNTEEIKEMLQIAADAKVKPWVQERPLKEANDALLDMEAGKARYRYVMVNEDYTGQ